MVILILVLLIVYLLYPDTKDNSYNFININNSPNLATSSIKCAKSNDNYKMSALGPKDFYDLVNDLPRDMEFKKNIQMNIMNQKYNTISDDMLNYAIRPQNLFIIP